MEDVDTDGPYVKGGDGRCWYRRAVVGERIGWGWRYCSALELWPFCGGVGSKFGSSLTVFLWSFLCFYVVCLRDCVDNDNVWWGTRRSLIMCCQFCGFEHHVVWMLNWLSPRWGILWYSVQVMDNDLGEHGVSYSQCWKPSRSGCWTMSLCVFCLFVCLSWVLFFFFLSFRVIVFSCFPFSWFFFFSCMLCFVLALFLFFHVFVRSMHEVTAYH